MSKKGYFEYKKESATGDLEAKAIQAGQAILRDFAAEAKEGKHDAILSSFNDEEKQQLFALLQTKPGLIALGNGWISPEKVQQWKSSFERPDEFGRQLIDVLTVFLTPQGFKAANSGLIPDAGKFLWRSSILELLITDRGQGLLAANVIDISTPDGFGELTDIGLLRLGEIINNEEICNSLISGEVDLNTVLQVLGEVHVGAIARDQRRGPQ